MEIFTLVLWWLRLNQLKLLIQNSHFMDRWVLMLAHLLETSFWLTLHKMDMLMMGMTEKYVRVFISVIHYCCDLQMFCSSRYDLSLYCGICLLSFSSHSWIFHWFLVVLISSRYRNSICHSLLVIVFSSFIFKRTTLELHSFLFHNFITYYNLLFYYLFLFW